MRIIDLGLTDYGKALAMQEQAVREVRAGGVERLFLLEHPPTITLGRNGSREFLLTDEDSLRLQGIAVFPTSRGGNITCHFPGQLVGYPIVRLNRYPGGIRGFFCDMEEGVIRLCKHFGLTANRRKNFPGVWVGENRKICSMGIAVKHWVSCHGFAFNVARNIALFSQITLCGIADAVPTSLAEELDNDDITMQEVTSVCARLFEQILTHPPLAQGNASA